MATGRTIGDLGEFGLIDRITAALPGGRATVLGPGDDAAVVSTPDGRVVATTDLLVEGRHFRRDWSSAEDVGHKAAAQNLADVAAMGAVPTALLVGLATPADLETAWVDGLARGLAAECAPLGAAVVGGDVVRSEVLTVAVTALGDLEGRPPLTRAGAAPGDVVAVAGRLGWAAAGLAVLGRGFRSPRAVVEAHRRPDVPYAAGPAAARLGAHALVDVSDGLVQDLDHVARASGVRIELSRAAVAVPEALQSVAAALNADPYGWLLGGGDDHALAGCFPADVHLPPQWTVVGSVVAVGTGADEAPGVLVDGAAWADGGHEHFR